MYCSLGPQPLLAHGPCRAAATSVRLGRNLGLGHEFGPARGPLGRKRPVSLPSALGRRIKPDGRPPFSAQQNRGRPPAPQSPKHHFFPPPVSLTRNQRRRHRGSSRTAAASHRYASGAMAAAFFLFFFLGSERVVASIADRRKSGGGATGPLDGVSSHVMRA